jgi:hypothetical protein
LTIEQGGKVFLEISGKLINAFIEPQFQKLSSGEMVTVQFSDWESMPELRRHLQGEVRVSQHSREFIFTGYTQLLDLISLTGTPKLTSKDLFIETNLSPSPAAYYYMGWVEQNDDIEMAGAECGPVESDVQMGYSLPEDIKAIRWSSDISYEQFYVYPVFQMPKELAAEAAIRSGPY